ncbi:B12-binding domain-containing radical SAM protein [Bradyrhizobium tunisiense]|uniref:B12-binding domain-containing radical SAM protein n=1 Tax=Bradyrhizobium tunisiense TaxID=3278709 RepID=UPI0035E11381
MKVLLIWPNSRNEVLGWGDLGAIAEPLALEYLAAGLKQDGHSIRILDMRLHPGALVDELRDWRPDIVGVTAFSMHVLTVLAICRRVKAELPHCVTVVGGHHATFLPEDFFELQVDLVVCGEGVQPLRRIASAITEGRPLSPIPGVWARVGTEFRSGGSNPTLRLEDLPQPDRTITSRDRASYFIDWMKPVALVRTSVGCPFRCTFCSLWKIMDGRYLMRDADSVIEEVSTIPEEFVFLIDDEAFINGRRMKALAQALRAAGLHKRYFTYCRMDSLVRNRDVLKEWREIGLERLFVGVDAISEKDLGEYNKKISIEKIETGFRIARELGIEIFAQFVVNTDYSRRDFQRLVRFIEHHKIRYPSFTVLTPIPGTELLSTFDNVIARQPNGRPNWDLFDCQNAVTPTALAPEEFRREYQNLYHVFKGSYTQYQDHPFLMERSIHDGDVGALTAHLASQRARQDDSKHACD